MLGKAKQRHSDSISTSDESARGFEQRKLFAGAYRKTAATNIASEKSLVKGRTKGHVAPTIVTATATPHETLVGQAITIAGQLTTATGAHMVAVPIVLYNADDPAKKVRVATTITDSSGHYRFTLTNTIASTHAYIVCAEGSSKYSRAQSTDLLVKYHHSRLRDFRQATLPIARARTIFNLYRYELLSILLILVGEGMLFAGYRVFGVTMQALNIVAVGIFIVWLRGERVLLIQALALISVFRVVNLSFALIPTMTVYWLMIVYGVMFLPLLMVIINEKMGRHDLGIDNLLRSLLLLPLGAFVGTFLGIVEYNILANEPLITNASAITFIQFSAIMIFFVALVEELLFRVLLQPQLIDRSGAFIGILISSIIFGVMHSGYASAYELLFAIGAGLILGFAFYKTKDLVFVVTIHAANNIILFGALPLFAHLPALG